jgi:aminoglycoside 6'-N-acetyltransferase I
MCAWRIRAVEPADRDQLAEMRAALWPDGSIEEHARELVNIIARGMSGTLPMTILVAAAADGRLIGFLEAGLRSHADGCDPAIPVGFVEGWFVREAFRNRGIGRELMEAAEAWARAQGCREMASDSLIDNENAHRAHQALGFEVVDRCVNFRKPL